MLTDAELDFDGSVFGEYVKLFASRGFTPPFRLCDEHPGSVLDSVGIEVFVVDANGELPDDVVADVAILIMTAVNRLADEA